MLLVTGANGQFAGWVIANLLEMVGPSNLAVCSRDPSSERAQELAAKGVSVRVGDFDRPETLAGAMEGIDKVLVIPTYSVNSVRLQQNLNALEAAKAAGVKHIVYPSFLGAGPDAMAEHSQLVHYPTEQAIQASGLTYTILRHALYADIMVDDLDQTLARGSLMRPGDKGASTYVAREDLGRSAATVMAEDGHENRIYSETMERSYTGADIAALISEVFEQPVRFESLSPEDWVEFIHDNWGVPYELGKSTLGTMRGLENGEFDIVTDDYAAITGAPPRDFRQFLLDLKAKREAA